MTVLNGSDITHLKNVLPFKLGTTSYIIPADIIPNVEQLVNIVDDIELVLFESPDISNIPKHNDIKLLSQLAIGKKCGYTVHLPTNIKAGSASRSERNLFVDGCKKIIERCAPLSPRNWILHCEGICPFDNADTIARWQDYCSNVIEQLCRVVDKSSVFALENLDYPWIWHKGLRDKHDISLCCDVGHLWLYESTDWKIHLIQMLPNVAVIHLHGVCGKKDHISLQKGNHNYILDFIKILLKNKYTGVVTLEIFNESDLRESLKVVKEIWEILS